MAIKLVKEFNLLNHEPVFVDSSYNEQPERIELDTNNFNGTVNYYFEVVAKNTHTSAQNLVLLKTSSTFDTTVSISASTTSWTRFRSSSYTPDNNNTTKRLGTYNTGDDSLLSCRAARVLIMQDAGSSITATESQIEIGSYEADLYGTSWKACTYPKYWYYNSANWDGTVSAYGEVVWVEADDKYAFSAKLQKSSDQSTWYDVTGGLIVDAAASETVTRTRQSSPFTLDASYPYYRLVHMNTGDKATRGYSIFCAKIIVVQTWETKDSQPNAANDTDRLYGDGGADEARGWKWTTGSAYSLKYCEIKVKKTGSPTDGLKLELASTIDGAALATSNIVNGSDITTLPAWHIFEFSSPYSLSASTTYYMRIVRTGSRDTSNYYRPYNNVCGSGCNAYTKDSGSWAAEPTRDQAFITHAATITKTESTFLLANSAQNTTGLKDFDQYYDAQNWEDVTVNFYHEGVAKTANMGIKLQSDPNGTPADVTNSSVTVTADQMTRGGSAMTMVDDKEYDLNITSVGSGGYLNMNRVVAIVVTGGATYKDFSGTAALASNVPSADINRLANFLGSATLASDLPSADLNRLMNTSGTAALASNCPDAALVRMADYSGSAALASNTPDAILSRMADYVGSAALNTSIPDATLNRWANFAGSSNPASDCPDALLSLLINMAGSADLATNCPDALLGRLMNTSGAATLATNCPDAILSLYLALAGTAALSTNLPDVDLSRLMNTSGAAALATSTPDAILGRLMNTLGAAALATDCPDALLGRIMNTSGITQLVTDCPDCNLSLFLPLSGTAALATNTPDADMNRLANFAGTSALQSQTLDALLSRLMNTGGSAVLSTNCPDVILSRLMNLLGNASLNTNIPDADLSLYIVFAGIAGMATDTPDAILSRIMDTMGQADLVTNCPDCDLTILGGVPEGGFYILLRRRRRS